jgi:hypothetical protein
VAVLVGGCASTGSGSSAAPAKASTEPSFLAASERPGASVSASSTPIPTSSPRPFTEISNPDLSIELPNDWLVVRIARLREQAVQGSSSTIAAVRMVNELLIRDIDSGAVRLFAFGPSGMPPWQATMMIQVTTAASIEEQTARITKLQTTFAKPSSSERTDVTLPVGNGVRLSNTADAPPGSEGQAVAARGIDYVIKLDDGRILWINSTAPEASTTFEGMIDWAVTKTLRRR